MSEKNSSNSNWPFPPKKEIHEPPINAKVFFVAKKDMTRLRKLSAEEYKRMEDKINQIFKIDDFVQKVAPFFDTPKADKVFVDIYPLGVAETFVSRANQELLETNLETFMLPIELT